MSFMLWTAASMRLRQQRFLDLLDEQALAAGLGQRPVLDGIARGLDGDDLDGVRAPASAGTAAASASRTRPAWIKRQLAAARAESQERNRHGACSSVGGPPTLEDTHARDGNRNELRRNGRRHRRGAGRRAAPVRPILANVIYSQLTEHRRFGGVVPEIAARAHLERIDGLVEEALDDGRPRSRRSRRHRRHRRPGLIGGVMVGVMTAKALAFAHDKPFLAINHLEGHALSVRLTEDVAFPICCCWSRAAIASS